MIEVIDPTELKWKSNHLPSPSVIDRESRIVVWYYRQELKLIKFACLYADTDYWRSTADNSIFTYDVSIPLWWAWQTHYGAERYDILRKQSLAEASEQSV